jgi:hypothetical protein
MNMFDRKSTSVLAPIEVAVLVALASGTTMAAAGVTRPARVRAAKALPANTPVFVAPKPSTIPQPVDFAPCEEGHFNGTVMNDIAGTKDPNCREDRVSQPHRTCHNFSLCRRRLGPQRQHGNTIPPASPAPLGQPPPH